jgi:hypothetical protein
MRFTKDIKVINKGLVMISQRLPETVCHFAVVNDALTVSSLLYCDNSSADDVSTTPVNKAVNNATAKYFLVINHSEVPFS